MNKLIITGASRGIGFATATQFLKNGWQVLNCSRRPCKLDNVVNCHVDLVDPNSIGKARLEIETFCSKADKLALVHCAAIHKSDRIQDLSAETFRKVCEANLIAPVQMNQMIIPRMKSGSAIIYIGSTLSEKAVPNAASYTITKHGIVGLMRSTCQDLAGTGIHTCCICPGFTDTDMLREHIDHDPNVLKMIQAKVGDNRLIQPEEIANVIFFSANNPVINGSVLHAHLGQIET